MHIITFQTQSFNKCLPVASDKIPDLRFCSCIVMRSGAHMTDDHNKCEHWHLYPSLSHLLSTLCSSRGLWVSVSKADHPLTTGHRHHSLLHSHLEANLAAIHPNMLVFVWKQKKSHLTHKRGVQNHQAWNKVKDQFYWEKWNEMWKSQKLYVLWTCPWTCGYIRFEVTRVKFCLYRW